MTTALITGASSGIGAVYADRLAARGLDLVLVARAADKLEERAARLRQAYAVAVEVLPADLTEPTQLAQVEARLGGAPIGLLVNNAGANLPGTFDTADAADLDWLIRLNVTAPTRLARAAIPGMVARGEGAIVNIGSVVGLAPDIFPDTYSATKSFLLTLSQALATQFGPKGIYVQAVLPAATRTDIWARSGRNVDDLPAVMEVEDLVDAALNGFDRREPVSIPVLPDAAQWEAFEAARRAMLPGFSHAKPAARYAS